MVAHNSPISKKHFLLLAIQIKANIQPHCVTRSSKTNKLIRNNQVQCLTKQETLLQQTLQYNMAESNN